MQVWNLFGSRCHCSSLWLNTIFLQSRLILCKNVIKIGRRGTCSAVAMPVFSSQLKYDPTLAEQFFLFSCPLTRRITILSRCQNSRLCLCISELMDKRHNIASLWRFNRRQDIMLWERDWSFQTWRWERGALSGPVEAFIRGRVTCIIKLESSIKLKCNFRRHLADRSSLPLNPSQRHGYRIPPRSRWSTTEKFMLSIITHFFVDLFHQCFIFQPILTLSISISIPPLPDLLTPLSSPASLLLSGQ